MILRHATATSTPRGLWTRPALALLLRRGGVRSFTSSERGRTAQPLKVAIIGAGPSAFYTASRILSLLPRDSPLGADVKIHMYERLPTPYGLVRYGVAPDHPEVKNCQHKFDELAHDPRFRYFGNTLISSQASSDPSLPTPSTSLSGYTYPHALRLPLREILPYYSTVLLAYGASLSNPLNIPGSSSSPANANGEDTSSRLEGIYPALSLVGWYNGHPAFSSLPITLEGIKKVNIIGQGNVALDVARILLSDISRLESTDIPESVLEVLSKSDVKTVTATGRRGPAQVAFTTKEMREMTNLPRVRWAGLDHDSHSALLGEARETVGNDRVRKRLLGVMEKANGVEEGDKEFKLDFLKSPTAFRTGTAAAVTSGASQAGNSSPRVGSIEWELNTLLASPPASPLPPTTHESTPVPLGRNAPVKAIATGEKVVESTDMVVESVGYRSEGLEAAAEGGSAASGLLPFDGVRGRVRNEGGRVVNEEGVVIPGMYASGWVARGPVGVIASTMHDAFSLAQMIIDDHLALSSSSSSSSSPAPGSRNGIGGLEPGFPSSIARGLKEGTVVDMAAWNRIDQAERERGKKGGKGKEREKFIRVEDMLAVLA